MRIQLFGDEVERIASVDPLTGEVVEELDRLVLFPASHYVTADEHMQRAIEGIEAELAERLAWFEEHGKLLEAQRLRMRTTYDLEMMREIGVCSGIENYSRHLDGRSAGADARTRCSTTSPTTTSCVLDESHVTVPQLHGQYEGDRSRKDTLVEHGFRLPSAHGQPAAALRGVHREGEPGRVPVGHAEPVRDRDVHPGRRADRAAHRPHRPRGASCARPRARSTTSSPRSAPATDRDQRVLVTTLTKKMAEDLTDYLLELGLRVRYLHSEVDTLERVEILRGAAARRLRRARRHQPAAGGSRPARGVAGRDPRRRQGRLPPLGDVADPDDRPRRPQRRRPGDHVRRPDDRLDAARRSRETNRRRKMQLEYNAEHGIDPQTVRKKVTDILEMLRAPTATTTSSRGRGRGRGRGAATRSGSAVFDLADVPPDDLGRLIQTLQDEMDDAATRPPVRGGGAPARRDHGAQAGAARRRLTGVNLAVRDRPAVDAHRHGAADEPPAARRRRIRRCPVGCCPCSWCSGSRYGLADHEQWAHLRRVVHRARGPAAGRRPVQVPPSQRLAPSARLPRASAVRHAGASDFVMRSPSVVFSSAASRCSRGGCGVAGGWVCSRPRSWR